MTYDPQTWVNGAAGATPVSAERLNHMEAGIVDAETRTAALVYASGAYPARPTGVVAGVIYVGPVQPTDWITGDIWMKNT